MVLKFDSAKSFPKNKCNRCTEAKKGFVNCNLGFEKCVYGEGTFSLLKNSRVALKKSIFSLKDKTKKALLELRKESPSKLNLESIYNEFHDISVVFVDRMSSLDDSGSPGLSGYIRERIKHHYLNAVGVVTNDLYLVCNYEVASAERAEHLEIILKRLDSFEKIIKNINKNPQLIDYLFAHQLPESINELELASS